MWNNQKARKAMSKVENMTICTLYTWFSISAKEWMDSDNMVADPVYKYAPNLNSITAKLLGENKWQQIVISWITNIMQSKEALYKSMTQNQKHVTYSDRIYFLYT